MTYLIQDKNSYKERYVILEEDNIKLREKYESTLKMNNFQNTNITDLRQELDIKNDKLEQVINRYNY